MTATLDAINKRIENLQKQAKRLQDRQAAPVLQRVKADIAKYGFTAADLGLDGARPSTKTKAANQAAGRPRKAKYADGNGNSWVGRGKRPQWLRDALESGKTLDSFAQ